MSTFDSNPDHRPRKQKFWQKKWFPLAAAGVAGLLLGSLAGCGGQKTEIVEVPGPERVVTKTVEKEVTPQSCLTALSLAEQGFTYSAEAMGYMNDALQAAGKLNVAGLTQANKDLEALNPKLTALAPKMKSNTAECRASAK